MAELNRRFEWTITAIKRIKFTSKDIFIYVSWEPTLYNKKQKPKATALKHPATIKRNGNKGWKIVWHDQWIELTQLTTSGAKWYKFYTEVAWPSISNEYDTNDDIIL